MSTDLRIGARVVWRSGSHNYVAEKVGTVVFMGPAGWAPEKAPLALKHWLDREWRDVVRSRKPDYSELCRIYPAPGGRGYVPPRDFYSRWTSRARYRFDKCLSGIVVAVHEYRQLSFDTAKATLKKPRRPLLYAPSADTLRVWAIGARRPSFPKEPVGTWKFTIHYQFRGDELLVQKGDEVMFEGRGHNEKAARRECLNRIAEELRYSRSNFVIRVRGIPVDATARRIDGVR